MHQEEQVIIYTCVTHDYDSVKPVHVAGHGETFVCFSERLKVPEGWQGRYLQSPSRLRSGHDISRFHKIFPHRLFPECRYSVYIDGNVSFNGGYRTLVDRVRASGAALGAFRHPDGWTVHEESDACKRFGKFDYRDLARCEEQLRHYHEDGFDLSEPVTANYLLVRDHHHPRLGLAMSIWWAQLFEFTKRDQVSLNYVLWKTGLPWCFLDQTLGIDSGNLNRYSHSKPVWRKILTRLKSSARTWPVLKSRGER